MSLALTRLYVLSVAWTYTGPEHTLVPAVLARLCWRLRPCSDPPQQHIQLTDPRPRSSPTSSFSSENCWLLQTRAEGNWELFFLD